MKKKIYILFYLLFFSSIVARSRNELEKKPLKILFMVSKFPYSLQTFVINQIRGLLDCGHDVYIWAKKQVDKEVCKDLVAYDFTNKIFYKTLPESQKKFDIIYCQMGEVTNKCIYFKKKYGLEGKIVTSFRGGDISRATKEDPHVYDELFTIGSLFLPVCDYFKKRLISLGCDEHKTIVLYSGVDCSKFEFKQNSIVLNEKIKIITTSRLVPEKGINYSIQAIAQLIEKYQNIEFLIIGHGKEYQKLQNLIVELHLEKEVKLLGYKSHEEVIQFLKEAHIFLHPSITTEYGNQDGIPNSMKEAMLIGLPVIATYHSGIPELVESQKSGILIAEKDVDSLVNAISYFIENPHKGLEMGKAGRECVKAMFCMKKLNNKLENLLYKVYENN